MLNPAGRDLRLSETDGEASLAHSREHVMFVTVVCRLQNRDIVDAHLAGARAYRVLGGLLRHRPAGPATKRRKVQFVSRVGVERQIRIARGESAVVQSFGQNYEVGSETVAADVGGLPDINILSIAQTVEDRASKLCAEQPSTSALRERRTAPAPGSRCARR